MKICPVSGHYFILLAVKICPFEGHHSMARDIIKYQFSMKNCPRGAFFTGHYYVLQLHHGEPYGTGRFSSLTLPPTVTVKFVETCFSI